jgi:hypothetical protein
MSLRIRRGTEAQRTALTFDLGEVVYTTDTKKLYIGDGVTVGGTNVLANMAGTGVTYNATTQQLDFSANGITTNNIAEGSTNKYFTNQRAQDAFGSLLTNGVQTGLTITYDSVNHALNVAVNDIASVSQDPAPSLGGNLTLNSRNIIGTGSLTITTGNISTASGTVSASGNITSSTGNIVATSGNVSASGTITATTGLGADLSLNSKNIIGAGDINITGTLLIKNSVQEITRFAGLNATGVVGTTPQFNIYSSRGTVSAPTASQPGDHLVNMAFGGYKSGSYFSVVNFITLLDGSANMSNASPAGGLGIAINDNAGGNSIFQFSYAGVLTAPVFRATSYTTTTMNAIPSPAAGMIIFNSTVNHFYGFNGTAWVAFTGP